MAITRNYLRTFNVINVSRAGISPTHTFFNVFRFYAHIIVRSRLPFRYQRALYRWLAYRCAPWMLCQATHRLRSLLRLALRAFSMFGARLLVVLLLLLRKPRVTQVSEPFAFPNLDESYPYGLRLRLAMAQAMPSSVSRLLSSSSPVCLVGTAHDRSYWARAVWVPPLLLRVNFLLFPIITIKLCC